MPSLCINTRDELLMFDLDNALCFTSDGNYTLMTLTDGKKVMTAVGLGSIEKMVAQSYAEGRKSPFVRLGRKVIVNTRYLFRINIPRQTLSLSVPGLPVVNVEVPKALLREYKDLLANGFNKQ